jgi:atypical dual specificity phosphatase
VDEHGMLRNNDAFRDDVALTKVVLPDEVTPIEDGGRGGGGLAGCTSLQEIALPATSDAGTGTDDGGTAAVGDFTYASSIIPGTLLLGPHLSKREAAEEFALGRVTLVLNCGTATIETDVAPVARVEIEDTSPPQDDIAVLLEDGADIIAEHINGGGGRHCIYVHCSEGVGRSPSVVVTYLARSRPLRAALAMVQSARSCACPAPGFLLPLAKREKEVFVREEAGKGSAQESSSHPAGGSAAASSLPLGTEVQSAGGAGTGEPPSFKSWKMNRAEEGEAQGAGGQQEKPYFDIEQYTRYYWESLGSCTFEEWLAKPGPPVPTRL